MIIIIDEASAKLASFYYHGEIFKPQWKRAVDMSSASDELHDEFQEKLPDELLSIQLPSTVSSAPIIIAKSPRLNTICRNLSGPKSKRI